MLLKLPNNVQESIFNLLGFKELAAVETVSKSYNFAINSYSYRLLLKYVQNSSMDPKFVEYLQCRASDPLLSLFIWDRFSRTDKLNSNLICSELLCEIKEADSEISNPAINAAAATVSNGEILLFESYSDKLCCYTSAHELLLFQILGESLEGPLARSQSFKKVPLQSIEMNDSHLICADKFGILFMLCPFTLRLLKTMNHRPIQCWSASFGLFPVSVKLATLKNVHVVFTCDQIKSFGMWNLQTEKVHTFPGQILFNERAVKIVPLENHFLMISQDRCFNVIVDLFCLTSENKVKLLGCIGFFTQRVNFLLPSIEIELNRNLENSQRRTIKLTLKYRC